MKKSIFIILLLLVSFTVYGQQYNAIINMDWQYIDVNTMTANIQLRTANPYTGKRNPAADDNFDKRFFEFLETVNITFMYSPITQKLIFVYDDKGKYFIQRPFTFIISKFDIINEVYRSHTLEPFKIETYPHSTSLGGSPIGRVYYCWVQDLWVQEWLSTNQILIIFGDTMTDTSPLYTPAVYLLKGSPNAK